MPQASLRADTPETKAASPDVLDRLAEHIRTHFARHRSAPISPTVTPREIRRHLKRTFDFSRPQPAVVVFD